MPPRPDLAPPRPTPGLRRVVAALLQVLLGAVVVATATAAERVSLAVGTVRGDLGGSRFVARGVELALTTGSSRATVRIASVELPPPLGRSERLVLECPRLATAGGRYRCAAGTLTAAVTPLGRQSSSVAFDYDSARGRLALELGGVALLGGSVAAKLGVDGAMLTASAAAKGVSVSDAAGTHATDKLGGHGELIARRQRGGWALEAQVALTAGAAYLDPVYVDFTAQPVSAEAAAHLAADGTLAVESFSARQQGAVELRGRGTFALQLPPLIRHAELEFGSVTFPGAGSYVTPFLATTPLRHATARGRLQGRAVIDDGAPVALDFGIDGLDFDDPGGALALTGLSGRIRWRAAPSALAEPSAGTAGAAGETLLEWRAGRLYGVALGASRLRLALAGRGFRLLEPAFIPVLDGGLAIETLRMRNIGLPAMWLRLDARLKPINLALASRALGWPEFGGTLAGTIPQAALEDGVLTFGGNLEASVFGGSVIVHDLRLEDPLGRFPRLFAGAVARDLDLGMITGTFSFGAISGRLGGSVDGLELFAWRPVRFDARLSTPAGDRSAHRISQRAIENLSSIGGGGVTAVLKTGALRFFREFRYRELGLACLLRNDVCQMSGLGPAPGGGYYIVRGAGLPRIDVVGSGSRVAWTQLVEQLLSATKSGIEVR